MNPPGRRERFINWFNLFRERYRYEFLAGLALLAIIAGIILAYRFFRRPVEPIVLPQRIELTPSPVVTAVPASITPVATPTSGTKVDGKVNLNTATTSQLMDLPGIGEVYAGRIIAARPFKSVNDLLKIAGIGPKKFSQIKDLVTIN
jgi:competence protein ComEA